MPSQTNPLEDAAKKIHSPSSAERLAASKVLMKQAYQETDKSRGEVLGRSDTLSGLRRALSDENPATAEAAALALGEIFLRYRKDKSALPDLARLTQSGRAKTRYAAAVAIGALDDPQRWELLAPLLEDRNDEVKQAVCGAVGDAGGKAFKASDRELLVPKLEALKRDGNPEVVEMARSALRCVQKSR